ncbi:amidophosphoribosyltransferase [Candidatus Termititenax persephonae]|uniref:Amidophosphoribosyltransferase n=1 Tax=Candidatus Termititenax persephonae TaxID=2218525 RepID=A0A388TFL6_9BACT|nr:amidophosphoribosyltransferase [Candidatus Termititenax persephonae]
MCGIFGIIGKDCEAGKLAYFGLYALQHRGQESAGIAVIDEQGALRYHKGMGLVPQVFTENIIQGLPGNQAIGHVRYSTTGASQIQNAQPILVPLPDHSAAVLAHNGNLINTAELRTELEADGVVLQTTSDTEIIGCLLARHYAGDPVAALAAIAPKLKGAFSLVLMCRDKLIGMRDPYGIRPLCFGQLVNGGYVLASESCALDITGAALVREVQKGEIVALTVEGASSLVYDKTRPAALCIFEYIYFARPDSYIQGRNVYKAREKFGELLFQEHPVEADAVIPVPDSGITAAVGFAKASGIPYEAGLIKNRYVGRTFINPSQIMREIGVRLKLNPLPEVLQGRRVVLLDDSIVRGTTSAKLVKLLRDSGAREVHFRVSAPPSVSPCYYGIDTPLKSELIAANYSVPEICRKLGADTLGYLSLKTLRTAVGQEDCGFCQGCFDGLYPAGVPQGDELGLVYKA